MLTQNLFCFLQKSRFLWLCLPQERHTDLGRCVYIATVVIGMPSKGNTMSVRNAKRHSECPKGMYSNYYCFTRKLQAGYFFDLHGRQKFFFLKDYMIVSFYQGFQLRMKHQYFEVINFFYYCYSFQMS